MENTNTMEQTITLCQDCNIEFPFHCSQSLDTYYTCGCNGVLCPNCHTNAEENQDEQRFHDFHSA